MAKKRTGLQSEIAGIFSGVPVPKKGGARSKEGGPPPKSDAPSSKSGGSVIPKPVVPKPVTPKPTAPVTPTPHKPVEPVPSSPRPKVTEIEAPERKTRKASPKISRRRKDKLSAHKAGVSSSRQKRAILLLILFSAALVVVLARPYFMSRTNPGPPRKPGKTDTGNSTKANIEIDWPVPPVYSTDLRDPMELGQRQRIIIETSDDLVVRGISHSEDRRYAVVGTETVEEGDIVPGTEIRVKKINPSSVEFEEDGKTWTQKVESDRK